MEGCIFHHKRWRGQTQGLLNNFRGRCLSAQHVKYFPKVVCICKETALPLPPIKIANLTSLGKWIKDASLDTTLATTHPMLVSMLKEAESNISPFCDSLIRALSIIKAASEGDYSALTPPPCPNETPPNPPPPTMTFELPITYTHLGVYFGTSGSNMKQLCKEHDVKVHLRPIKTGNDSLETRGRNRCSYLTGEKFEVTVTGGVREKNDFLAVRKEMLLRAQLVCGKREKHMEHVNAWRRQRCNRSVALPRVNLSSAKEAAVEHFEKKQHHKKQKGSPEKKTPSILSDSRCLHCLGEYQPGQTEEGACSCHPGFLVPLTSPTLEGYRTKWSCCQLLSTEQHPTHKAHAATGCSSARHLWRPGKTGKNGHKTIVKEPDFSVH